MPKVEKWEKLNDKDFATLSADEKVEYLEQFAKKAPQATPEVKSNLDKALDKVVKINKGKNARRK